MKNLNENALMQEMELQEMMCIDGGFFPIVILGYTITAKMAGTFIAGCATAGVACGIAAATNK